MNEQVLEKLRVPGDQETRLELLEGDFISGTLKGGERTFPVVNGIPRLLDSKFDKHTSGIFSDEWRELTSDDDVWGRPVYERMKEIDFLEMADEALRGCDFLDVGCGNGIFAQTVARQYHARVVGIDISTGLELANSIKTADDTVEFIQADAQYPPLARESFDVIWCAGSLHHTPDPQVTFQNLVPLLKPGGRIFVWLYTAPKNKDFRYYARRVTKAIVCRMPRFLRSIAVVAIAAFTLTKQTILHKVFKRELNVPYVPKFRHHRMMARDSFTIRYDWLFETEDIVKWHQENNLKTIYSKYVTEDDGDWLAALAEK